MCRSRSLFKVPSFSISCICLVIALVLGTTPGAQASFFYYRWAAGSGLLPQNWCPRWTLLNSANVEVPELNPLRLRLSTNSPGEVMFYTQQGPDFKIPSGGEVDIQFRMKYVSGSTSDSARDVASVLFQTSGGAAALGNILWIGKDRIFLWSADGVVGPEAFLDTDGDYHTYHITWDTTYTTSISVFVDGVLQLVGSQISRPQWTAQARIVWGQQFSGAQGETRWQSVFHMYEGPFDLYLDPWTPDSCDNCLGVDNPLQDDANHNGIGDACEPSDTLQFVLHSPVDMVVTDPVLDSIGKPFNYISDGSSYTENTDSDGDGKLDDIVTIPRPHAGRYLIRIFPELGANPNDKYTLTIRLDGSQLTTPSGQSNALVSSLPVTVVWDAAGTLPGDVNADGKFTASDVIYMVNFVFKGGPGPIVPGHADINCDGNTTSADIIRMVGFVFKSSTPPCARTASYPG